MFYVWPAWLPVLAFFIFTYRRVYMNSNLLSVDELAETLRTSLLTVDELAETLRTPKSWVYGKTRLKGDDQIPCIRVGKYIRFQLGEVMDWLRKQSDDE